MVNLAAADLEQSIINLNLRTVAAAAVVLLGLIVITILLKNKVKKVRAPLFAMICTTVIGATLTLFGSTIYLNTKADSGGPVHWHADIEFWACGSELELKNPTGLLSNKIGSATYHEHNDKRVHLEGVVVDKRIDAGISKFMNLVGGDITATSIKIPVEDSIFESEHDGDSYSNDTAAVKAFAQKEAIGTTYVNLDNTKTCGGQPSELQVFVYHADEVTKTYRQDKLADPTAYVMRDEATVPAGDCVIVEFGPRSNTTDKICLQYGVRDSVRCTSFGVDAYTSELCNYKQVDYPRDTVPSIKLNEGV